MSLGTERAGGPTETYNAFGKNKIRLKVGEPKAKPYEIGDHVDAPDGLYLGHGGAVMILNKMFIAEFGVIFDEQGCKLDIEEIRRKR